MARLRYKFNPDTLLFEKTYTTKRKKFMRILRGLLYSLPIAIAYYAIYIQFFDTPHSSALRRNNAEVIVKYDLLNKRFAEANAFLTQIQRRDNNVYRASFGLDIIPPSVRNAGFGGVDRYDRFEDSEYSSILIKSSQMLDILTKKAYIQSVSFDTIAKEAARMEQMVICMPSIAPVAIGNNVRITDVFGWRTDPIYRDERMHNGMDFSGPMGTKIVATGNGKVTAVEYSFAGYGNSVVISHGFGYTTRYAHLSSIDVREGQEIKRGDKVGALGNTGKSTGPHLHYEVRYRNNPENPLKFFDNDMTLAEYERILKTAQTIREFD